MRVGTIARTTVHCEQMHLDILNFHGVEALPSHVRGTLGSKAQSAVGRKKALKLLTRNKLQMDPDASKPMEPSPAERADGGSVVLRESESSSGLVTGKDTSSGKHTQTAVHTHVDARVDQKLDEGAELRHRRERCHAESESSTAPTLAKATGHTPQKTASQVRCAFDHRT